VNASEKTAVDRLYEEANSIIQQLQKNSETSLQVSANDNFRKTLLLAAASQFEHKICSLLIEFVNKKSNGSSLVESFVRNKAIARQYHSLFQWDKTNANQFFGLFGKEFSSWMSEKIKKSDQLSDSIKAFLDLGNTRNRLVHQDYASFPLDKTLDDVYQLYQKGQFFVENLLKELHECDLACRAGAVAHVGGVDSDKSGSGGCGQ
jgi:hypothetical protein